MSRSEVLYEPRGRGLGSIKPKDKEHKGAESLAARERGTFPAPLALGYEIHALAGRRASAKPARRAVVGGHRS
jgi:hypothetical protein